MSDINKKITGTLLFLLLICIIALPFLYGIYHTSFNPDENLWILESKYYKLLVLEEQPISQFSNDPNDDKWILMSLWDQPCIVKKIFIIVSDVFHIDMGKIDLARWDFAQGEGYNSGRNAIPPKSLLRFYRYITSVFGILSCVLVFFIGMKASNVYGGAFAAILIAYNPLMVISCTRAMAEGILIFFIVLSVYLAGLFLKELSRGGYARASFLSVITGMAIGLAAGTKLNGGISFVIFVGLCLGLLAMRPPGNILKDKYVWTIILSVLLAAAIAFFVFIFVDPFLRLAPAQNTMLMLSHRMETAKFQGINFNAQLNNFPERIAYIWKTLFSGKFHIPVFFILVLAGLWFMVRDELRCIAKNGHPSSRSLVLAWALFTFMALLCTLSLSWDRYLVPLIPPVSLLSGYLVAGIRAKRA